MSELKQYSEGTNKIKLFTDNLASDANFVYSFDCVPMDLLFGGGIYSGKIYEFFGENSHGKSTLALEVTKAFAAYWKQKQVEKYGILWEEAESALDKTRALYMECPVEKFLVCEADTLETFKASVDATLDKAIKNNMPLIIVCDTIAALQTENEAHPKIDKNGKANTWSGGMMEKPRVIWAMLRDLTPKLARANCTLILVNQVYGGGEYEAPESPGGGGIKFYSSARIRVMRSAFEKVLMPSGEERTVGIRTRLISVKNKLTLPNQQIEVVIKGETGIDKFETTYNFLVNAKHITMSGSWKNLEFPVKNGYYDQTRLQNPEDPKSGPLYVEPEFEKLTFQAPSKLKEMIEFKNPQIKDWMNYLCYKHACTFSPLMKVKIVDKAWAYEEKFYGKRMTELTEKEKSAAAILHKIQAEEDEK